jgi:hypothetical protein
MMHEEPSPEEFLFLVKMTFLLHMHFINRNLARHDISDQIRLLVKCLTMEKSNLIL